MNSLHITVSAVNLICGLMFVVGVTFALPVALGIGVFIGYWANLIAVAIAFFIIVLAISRMRSNGARHLLAGSWLGLVNGVVVLLFWALLVASGQVIPKS